MTLFNTVKKLLEDYPKLRNSDKSLLWAVWWKKGLIQTQSPNSLSRILYMNFLQAPSSESVTRARRKVQELFPNLDSTGMVKVKRHQKELTKGGFVFTES